MTARSKLFRQFNSKDELRRKLMELYYTRRLSQREIAGIFGVCQTRISQFFKEFGLIARNKSEAASLAKSKGRYRSFDPEKDEELAVQLNALIHTDFYKEKWRRKIRIRTATTHLGMIIFLDKLAKNHDLPAVKCEPRLSYKNNKPLRFQKAHDYEWTIKLPLDESFNQILEDSDKSGYVERLSRFRKELFPIYFTRAVECDGSIVLTKKRSKITGKVGIYSKDYQHLLSIKKAINEVLRLPTILSNPDRRDKCANLYMLLTNPKVMDFFEEEMNFIHPEKMWMKELALKYVGEYAKLEILEEIRNVNRTIKRLTNIMIQLAKERLSLPRGRRVIQSDDLIKLALQRFFECRLDNDKTTQDFTELLRRLGVCIS